MASLTGQSVASSYEQLLHVDRDGGGNGTTLVDLKDGDNGTTFALQLATDKINVNGAATFTGNITGTTQLLTNHLELRVDDAEIYFENTANSKYHRIKRNASDQLIFDQYNGSATVTNLTIDNAGKISVGGSHTAEADIAFEPDTYTTANQGIRWQDPVVTTDAIVQGVRQVSNVGIGVFIGANSQVDTSGGISRFNTSEESSFISVDPRGDLYFGTGGTGANPSTRMHINSTGNVNIGGALSKGSGSFKIDHPLESKKDTHHLVHSFVEAPQADNIYRGKATLSNGSIEINLDTISGMSEGTFVLLNTDIQCFTSNESDWDSVKGFVSGNILTISCQNEDSTATVSWLVIGERQDQHMLDTSWTDENGKVIVEPEKPEESTEESSEESTEESSEESSEESTEESTEEE